MTIKQTPPQTYSVDIPATHSSSNLNGGTHSNTPEIPDSSISFPKGNLLERAFNEVPVRLYNSNTILLEQDCPVEHVYKLEQGLVKYTFFSYNDSDDDAETIISLTSQAGIIIDSHCALTGISFCSIELLTKGYLRRIPVRNYVQLVRENLDVCWRLHQIHSVNLNDHLNKIAVLRCNSSQYNLELILCEFIKGMKLMPGKDGYTFKLPLKYWEIAQLMTISPEHLCRLMKKMESQGLIKRLKSMICIPDINKFSINNQHASP